MKARLSLALAGALSAAVLGVAFADDDVRAAPAYKLLTTIPVPPIAPNTQMRSFDISWIDAETQLYYLADRSNKAVDVVDARRNVFKKQIQAGFTGFNGSNDTSGPNGVVVSGHWLFVTDYPSRVFSIDLRTDTVADMISTGGVNRTDELAYDPEDSLILAVNNADDPPFASLIKVDRNTGKLTLLKRITFDDATNGAEQPVWHPGTGRFYISIPQIGANPQDGAVKRISTAGVVEATYPVRLCQPAGLTVGPNGDLLIGCSVVFDEAGNVWNRDAAGLAPSAKPESVIIDARNGSIDRRVQGVGGNDEVWYNPGDNRYYLAARNQPGGSSPGNANFSPVLGIVDAGLMRLDQVVPTVNVPSSGALPSGSAHSVAVNPHNNHAFVPLPADNVVSNCHTGCIGVYGSPRRDRDDD